MRTNPNDRPSSGELQLQEQPWVDPIRAFWSVKDHPLVAFLDSSYRGFTDSRWSYLCLDPLFVVTVWPERNTLFSRELGLEIEISDWRSCLLGNLRPGRKLPPNAPPFHGGWIGWFSYELGPQFDVVKTHAPERSEPLAVFCFYDSVDCFDQGERRRWRARLGSGASQALESVGDILPVAEETEPLPFVSNTPKDTYRRNVSRSVEYVRAGDVYQVNLTQIFSGPAPANGPAAYLNLRTASPCPYGAYLDTPAGKLLSSSPELFIDFEADTHLVTSRPIKGTRRRGADHQEDVRLAEELAASAKDRAENVMIVDLVRNDLGRVCNPGSVETLELCRRETHPSVFHLVSTVRGTVQAGMNILDILDASFPGGSIIGAPKIRATEIITELEPGPRGAYTGALGYINIDGSAKLAMGIRIARIMQDKAWFGAGGGIVADSSPEDEYQESLIKAGAVMKSLGGFLEE